MYIMTIVIMALCVICCAGGSEEVERKASHRNVPYAVSAWQVSGFSADQKLSIPAFGKTIFLHLQNNTRKEGRKHTS